MFSNTKEQSNATIEVFLTNAGAYSQGIFNGDWYKLPVKSVSSIYKEEKKKNGKINGFNDEFFISDYNAPFNIDELASLSDLNKLAECLQADNVENIEDLYFSLEEPEKITPIPLENDEDILNQLAQGMTPAEIINNWCSGDCSANDDYLYIDPVLNNFRTLSRYQWLELLKNRSSDIMRQYAQENNINL